MRCYLVCGKCREFWTAPQTFFCLLQEAAGAAVNAIFDNVAAMADNPEALGSK